MFRSTTLALAATAAVSLAACGSGDPSRSAGVTPGAAKATIERAEGLQLSAVKVPAEAREQGLGASYSNAATAAKDKQVVGLFVMKDAGVADEVADQVRGTAPQSAQLIRHGKVMTLQRHRPLAALAGALIATIAGLALFSAVASAHADEPAVPARIQVPAGNTRTARRPKARNQAPPPSRWPWSQCRSRHGPPEWPGR